MKTRKIILTIAGIIAQLLCVFYVIWYSINVENKPTLIQCFYIIAWGLLLLLWILVDITDVLDFVAKKRREKNKD